MAPMPKTIYSVIKQWPWPDDVAEEESFEQEEGSPVDRIIERKVESPTEIPR